MLRLPLLRYAFFDLILVLLFVNVAFSQWYTDPENPMLIHTTVDSREIMLRDSTNGIAYLSRPYGSSSYSELMHWDQDGVSTIPGGYQPVAYDPDNPYIISWNSQAGITSDNHIIYGIYRHTDPPDWTLIDRRVLKTTLNGEQVWGSLGIALPDTLDVRTSSTWPFPDDQGRCWFVALHEDENEDSRHVVYHLNENLEWEEPYLLFGVQEYNTHWWTGTSDGFGGLVGMIRAKFSGNTQLRAIRMRSDGSLVGGEHGVWIEEDDPEWNDGYVKKAIHPRSDGTFLFVYRRNVYDANGQYEGSLLQAVCLDSALAPVWTPPIRTIENNNPNLRSQIDESNGCWFWPLQLGSDEMEAVYLNAEGEFSDTLHFTIADIFPWGISQQGVSGDGGFCNGYEVLGEGDESFFYMEKRYPDGSYAWDEPLHVLTVQDWTTWGGGGPTCTDGRGGLVFTVPYSEGIWGGVLGRVTQDGGLGLEVGVDEYSSTIVLPSSPTIQLYPNPCNATATVHVNLPAPGELNVALFNILGQKVMTLVDGHQVAGQHRITLDASALASGVYFVRAEALDQYSSTRKIVLMK